MVYELEGDELKGEAVPEAGTSYFLRHWRGELSLSCSYWINGVLVWGLGINILWLFAMTAAVVAFRNAPGLALSICLALLAFQIGAYIWALVGTWRAAANYRGPVAWSILARVVMGLGVVISIGRFGEALDVIGHIGRFCSVNEWK